MLFLDVKVKDPIVLFVKGEMVSIIIETVSESSDSARIGIHSRKESVEIFRVSPLLKDNNSQEGEDEPNYNTEEFARKSENAQEGIGKSSFFDDGKPMLKRRS